MYIAKLVTQGVTTLVVRFHVHALPPEEGENHRLEPNVAVSFLLTAASRWARLRHNAAYKEALFLHGEGLPHSDDWARARHLYESVLSDE